jgi:hypothetical protein
MWNCAHTTAGKLSPSAQLLSLPTLLEVTDDMVQLADLVLEVGLGAEALVVTNPCCYHVNNAALNTPCCSC